MTYFYVSIVALIASTIPTPNFCQSYFVIWKVCWLVPYNPNEFSQVKDKMLSLIWKYILAVSIFSFYVLNLHEDILKYLDLCHK